MPSDVNTRWLAAGGDQLFDISCALCDSDVDYWPVALNPGVVAVVCNDGPEVCLLPIPRVIAALSKAASEAWTPDDFWLALLREGRNGF